MEQRDLIKLLESNGWYKIRDGGNHIIYTNGTRCEPIPRHKELNESSQKQSSSGGAEISPAALWKGA